MPDHDLKALERIQEAMRGQVKLEDGFESLDLFCACDVSYDENDATVAFVTLSKDFEIMEKKIFQDEASVPYIPTFLSFREGPLLIDNFHELKVQPDMLFIDGHGIAHPRELGLASFVGVKLNVPTIGIAKKNLCSEIPAMPSEECDALPMYMHGKMVGHVVKSTKGSKPIYVSPGHLISVDSAVKVVKMMLKGHKLPEPSRLAHQLTREARKRG